MRNSNKPKKHGFFFRRNNKSADNSKTNNKLKSSKNIVILGQESSGKSTFTKQITLAYTGFNLDREQAAVRRTILNSFFQHFEIILSMFQADNEQATELRKNINHYLHETQTTTLSSLSTIKNEVEKIMLAKEFKEVSQEKNLGYYYFNKIEYFLKDLDRVCSPNYSPTKEDYLRMPIRRVGVTEYKLINRYNDTSFVSIGGKRNERKKWLTFLVNHAAALILCISLSNFDEVCFEDNSITCLQDSLDRFKSFVNTLTIQKVNPVLLLTGTDTLEKKVEKYVAKGNDLIEFFPSLNINPQESEYEQVLRHMKEKFVNEVSADKRDDILMISLCCLNEKEVMKAFARIHKFAEKNDSR